MGELIQLEPKFTLQFNKSASGETKQTLKLTNNSGGLVAFKVKTTAPKAYLVRPSSGTLKLRETQEVQIILQTNNAESNAGLNNNKFLVQAVQVQRAEAVTKEQWAEFPKDQIQETKLSVEVHEGAEPVQSNVPTATA